MHLGVTPKCMSPMGRIPNAHVRLIGWTQQEPRIATYAGGRNLAAFDGEVCPESGGTGGE